MRIKGWGSVVGLLLLAACATAGGQYGWNYAEQVLDRAERSVVAIQIGDHLGATGTVVAPGIILTAAHVTKAVVANEERGVGNVRYTGGEQTFLSVLWEDEERDVALVRAVAPAYSQPAEISCEPLRLGERVIVVGNPARMEWIAADGIVATRHTQSIRKIGPHARIVAVASYPGNSGGPVFDTQGRVRAVQIAVPTLAAPPTPGLPFRSAAYMGYSIVTEAAAWCEEVKAQIEKAQIDAAKVTRGRF